jgi:LAGLIDADG DNA endonuclease family
MVFNIISHFCSSIPLFSTGLRNGTKTFALGFKTRALPCFTEQRYLWYPQGKKIVPSAIYDLLTPIALAH